MTKTQQTENNSVYSYMTLFAVARSVIWEVVCFADLTGAAATG